MKKVDNERIRSIRAALRMSQEEFAREIGVSFVMIDRWEHDKVKPSAHAMRRIEALASRAEENQKLSAAKIGSHL
ncbi:MAG TPA: helix-turn-helix transcriptional regulator [Methylomirabilota bacterium]|nr:helix-turn-helix transcriptional regulator [Methylomirabilota bacterium]